MIELCTFVLCIGTFNGGKIIIRLGEEGLFYTGDKLCQVVVLDKCLEW